jgi:hypothetical protein
MELDGLGFRVYIYIYIYIYNPYGWGMDIYLGKREVATLALLYVLWNNGALAHSLWPSNCLACPHWGPYFVGKDIEFRFITSI